MRFLRLIVLCNRASQLFIYIAPCVGPLVVCTSAASYTRTVYVLHDSGVYREMLVLYASIGTVKTVKKTKVITKIKQKQKKIFGQQPGIFWPIWLLYDVLFKSLLDAARHSLAYV